MTAAAAVVVLIVVGLAIANAKPLAALGALTRLFFFALFAVVVIGSLMLWHAVQLVGGR